MKKILFAAFAATLLAASCQKTEVIAPTTGSPITFSTEMKKITKADPSADADNNVNLRAQGFSIWAYADFDLTNATNVDKTSLIYDGMKDWFVQYIEQTETSPAKWDPRKEFYWPGTGKDLRFFAVSASRKADGKLNYNVGITHNIDPESYTQTVEEGQEPVGDPQAPVYPSMIIEDFSVADGNEDLMVADFIKQNQGQNGKTVSLNFHHALSKVQFVFTTSTNETEEAKQPKVYVQKIELKALKYEGDLNVTSTLKTAANETTAEVDEVAFTWTPTENTKSFTASSENNDITGTIEWMADNILPAKGLKLTPNSQDGQKFATWLMLPQAIAEKQVEITYVINTRQFKAIFPLYNEDITSWDVNQYIRYKVNLSPNLITFSATSTDWTTATDVEHQN